jgi:hypothetical protein
MCWFLAMHVLWSSASSLLACCLLSAEMFLRGSAAYELQGINVEGMLHQLEAALGRSKAASGSASGIQAVEDDLDYAERLLGVCKPPPGRLVAALAKGRTALSTQKIGLQ